MNINLIEGAGILLFIIGFYGISARRNIVKTILSLGVMEIGVIVFFLGVNYLDGMRPPIGTGTVSYTHLFQRYRGSFYYLDMYILADKVISYRERQMIIYKMFFGCI